MGWYMLCVVTWFQLMVDVSMWNSLLALNCMDPGRTFYGRYFIELHLQTIVLGIKLWNLFSEWTIWLYQECCSVHGPFSQIAMASTTLLGLAAATTANKAARHSHAFIHTHTYTNRIRIYTSHGTITEWNKPLCSFTIANQWLCTWRSFKAC